MAENKASDAIQLAIKEADPFRRQGTAYLHTRDDHQRHSDSNPTGAVVVPISVATTFEQRDPGVARAKDDPNSFGAGYEYSRTGTYLVALYPLERQHIPYDSSRLFWHCARPGNPTRGAFERAVATAENAKYCVAFASGSAATSAVIHLLYPGDHVLVH